MHHVKSIKKVRELYLNKKGHFKKIEGAYARKQVPLCREHHDSLHAGRLKYAELKRVFNYK